MYRPGAGDARPRPRRWQADVLVHLQDPRLHQHCLTRWWYPNMTNPWSQCGYHNRLTKQADAEINTAVDDGFANKMAMRDCPPCCRYAWRRQQALQDQLEMAVAMAARLRAFAQSEPMRLVLIPSLRTPAALTETLGAELKKPIHALSAPMKPTLIPEFLASRMPSL